MTDDILRRMGIFMSIWDKIASNMLAPKWFMSKALKIHI